MEVRRRKLKFRASRRGFRELDLYVEAFADEHLPTMNEPEMIEFEAILDIPDTELYSWVLGQDSPPQEHQSPMLERLLAFDYANRKKQ